MVPLVEIPVHRFVNDLELADHRRRDLLRFRGDRRRSGLRLRGAHHRPPPAVATAIFASSAPMTAAERASTTAFLPTLIAVQMVAHAPPIAVMVNGTAT